MGKLSGVLVYLLIYLGVGLPLLLLTLWAQENFAYTVHFLAGFLIAEVASRAAKLLTKETLK